MAYTWELLPRGWGKRIKDAVYAAAQTASRNEGEIGKIVSNATSRHFRQLEHGGSDRDISGRTIDWQPNIRHPRTLFIRSKLGLGPTPLLSTDVGGPGAIEEGATMPRAFANSRRRNTLSDFFYTPLDLKRKLAKNQLGLFAKTSWGEPIKFPERPFLYWDKDMANMISILVKRNFERRF